MSLPTSQVLQGGGPDPVRPPFSLKAAHFTPAGDVALAERSLAALRSPYGRYLGSEQGDLSPQVNVFL